MWEKQLLMLSLRERFLLENPEGRAECISVCLDDGVNDEAVCRFLFMVLEDF